MTFLDDGAHSIALADALLGRIPYARPNVREAGPNALLGSLTRDRMLGLAARERLTITTAFPFGDERTDGLRALGVAVDRHTERAEPVRSLVAEREGRGDGQAFPGGQSEHPVTGQRAEQGVRPRLPDVRPGIRDAAEKSVRERDAVGAVVEEGHPLGADEGCGEPELPGEAVTDGPPAVRAEKFPRDAVVGHALGEPGTPRDQLGGGALHLRTREAVGHDDRLGEPAGPFHGAQELQG